MLAHLAVAQPPGRGGPHRGPGGPGGQPHVPPPPSAGPINMPPPPSVGRMPSMPQPPNAGPIHMPPPPSVGRMPSMPPHRGGPIVVPPSPRPPVFGGGWSTPARPIGWHGGWRPGSGLWYGGQLLSGIINRWPGHWGVRGYSRCFAYDCYGYTYPGFGMNNSIALTDAYNVCQINSDDPSSCQPNAYSCEYVY